MNKPCAAPSFLAADPQTATFLIVIAESDPFLCETMKLFLQREGYQVQATRDGHHALRLCQQRLPDLVVASEHLPELDGFALCSQLRQLPGWEERPVLLTTFLDDEAAIGQAFAAGAEDYLTKPINWQVLRHRIGRVLAHHRTDQVVQQGLVAGWQASEHRFRDLFNAMLNGFALHEIIVDHHGCPCDYRFLEVNPAFEAMTGLSANRVVGHTALEVLPGLESCWVATYGQVALGGKAVRFQNDCAELDKHYEVFAFSPQTGQFATVFMDISERKSAEEALRRAMERAEEASRVKSEFLANMSHEMRTPMNAILGMADLLAETPLSSQQRGYLQTFRAAGEKLLRIINDILELNKVEGGRVHLEQVPLHLAVEMAASCHMVAAWAEAKGVVLQHHLQRGIPETLLGDPSRLRQIFYNLLSNAVKFTPQGRIDFSVRLGEETDWQGRISLIFRVQDTGIGIPADRLESIFDSFVQVDGSLTRHYGGTGLGLTLVKQLVSLMGGSLQVTSALGEGSCFTITLPFATLIRPLAKPGDPTASLVGACTMDPQELHYTILLVDDSLDNRLLVEAYFKGSGHRLVTVDNGASALEKLQQESFDLVLMDVQMPVMDGYTATRLWRRWEEEHHLPRLPIIALTAHVLPEDIHQCLDVGCDAHLAKPVKKKILLEFVEEFAKN